MLMKKEPNENLVPDKRPAVGTSVQDNGRPSTKQYQRAPADVI